MTSISPQQISYSDFLDLGLIPNPKSPDTEQLETYGDDLAHVRSVLNDDPCRIWTVVDCDGELALISGYHFVNRCYYLITEKPSPHDDVMVFDF